MIVADTNVVAYLMIPGAKTRAAEALYLKDSEWAAPHLLKSQFLNVLATYCRKGHLSLEHASLLMEQVQEVLAGRWVEVRPRSVLEVSAASGLSGYDSEFVAVALELKVPMYTEDAQILKAFPSLARRLPKTG